MGWGLEPMRCERDLLLPILHIKDAFQLSITYSFLQTCWFPAKSQITTSSSAFSFTHPHPKSLALNLLMPPPPVI